MILSEITLTSLQHEAINKFFTKANGMLLAGLPTGTGKTIVALEICKKIIQDDQNAKIIVVVPATLKDNFKSNIYQHKYNDVVNEIVLASVEDLEKNYNGFNLFICSYNYLNMYVNTIIKYDWKLVVCDEFHYAKNADSSTYKSLSKLRDRTKYILGLTASYVSNRIEEFVVLLSLILNDKNMMQKSKSYIQKIDSLIYKKTSFSKEVMFQEIKYLKDFIKRQSNHIYIPKEEKVRTLVKRPKVVSKVVEVDINSYEWKSYKYVLASKLESKKSIFKILSGNISLNEVRKISNIVISLQQVLVSPDYIYLNKSSKMISSKVQVCLKIIKKYNKKCIVFTPFFEHGAKLVYEYFKKNGLKVSIYSGEESEEERFRAVDEFNNGELQVLILTLAGKEGINLPKCEQIHFISLVWNPEVLDQVIGRALRMTSKVPVVEIYWYFAKIPHKNGISIDHTMSRILNRKRILKKAITNIISENFSEV